MQTDTKKPEVSWREYDGDSPLITVYVGTKQIAGARKLEVPDGRYTWHVISMVDDKLTRRPAGMRDEASARDWMLLLANLYRGEVS